MYWLQPASTIRYLEFWFPTMTLALVVWVYAVSYSEVMYRKNNWIDMAILLGAIVMVGLLRYMGPLCCLTSSAPPQFFTVAIFTACMVGVALLFKALSGKPGVSTILIIALLIIFIFLKNDALAEQASRWFRRITGQNPTLANSIEIVWLGYSYMAFRLLHVLRDKQNGRLPKDASLAEFASYVVFFPAFTAGPIDRVQNFLKKLRENLQLTPSRFIPGMERLSMGVFKKFVVADSLALIALSSQNAGQIQSGLWGWVIVYAYAFRILLDFSGYTDIAIGIGIFAGIQLPENFNHPYLKNNLTEFWNNWHMTLTQWFRAYFFNPLTRSLRSAKVNIPLPAIIILGQFSTMVLIGLWHGISWNFVVWGIWHGAGLFLHNRWSAWVKNSSLQKQPFYTDGKIIRAAGILLTFHYAALGWIWFVVPSTAEGWQFMLTLFGVQ